MVQWDIFYEKNYKKLMFVPIALLLISFILIAMFYSKNGDIFYKDVSLKGGVSATVYTDKEFNTNEIEKFLKQETGSKDVFVRSLSGIEGAQNGFLIEVSGIEADVLERELGKFSGIELNDENFFLQETGSRLGDDFYNQMLKALVYAFILIGIVVFITFRAFVPSLAVILSAFTDILVTIAIIEVIGLRVSSAGIAALLLLIGYSIDTDVLLTTRVVKRREERMWVRVESSIKTGLTMTVAALVVMIIGILFSQSIIIKEMFIIILCGLLVDVIATYFMNAPLLTWYMRRKYNE